MTNKQVNFLKFIKHVSKPFSIESEFTDSLEIVHTLSKGAVKPRPLGRGYKAPD